MSSASGQPEEDVRRYRVVLMGEGGVGKTSLLRRFLFDQFSEKYRQTVEDLHSKAFDVNGVPLLVDFVDTAGALSFPAMRRLNIGAANAFVLVYCAHPDPVGSFQRLREIFDEILEIRGSQTINIPIVVVENQIDLFDAPSTDPPSVVDDAVFKNGDSSSNSQLKSRRNSGSPEVEEFLLKFFDYKICFLRTSAKTGQNVAEIFCQLVKLGQLLNERKNSSNLADYFGETLNFSSNPSPASARPHPWRRPVAAALSGAKRRFSLQTHRTLGHIPHSALNEAERLVATDVRRFNGNVAVGGGTSLTSTRRHQSDRAPPPPAEPRKGSLPATSKSATATVSSWFMPRKSKSRSGDRLDVQECYVQ